MSKERGWLGIKYLQLFLTQNHEHQMKLVGARHWNKWLMGTVSYPSSGVLESNLHARIFCNLSFNLVRWDKFSLYYKKAVCFNPSQPPGQFCCTPAVWMACLCKRSAAMLVQTVIMMPCPAWVPPFNFWLPGLGAIVRNGHAGSQLLAVQLVHNSAPHTCNVLCYLHSGSCRSLMGNPI